MKGDWKEKDKGERRGTEEWGDELEEIKGKGRGKGEKSRGKGCLLYTSPSPRDS